MQKDNLTHTIQRQMEDISLILMRHEKKDYCLAKVHPLSWKRIPYKDTNGEQSFIIIPSPAFDRLIIHRVYLKIVDKYPTFFGTHNDWDIVRAIKEYDKEVLLREYSDHEFFDYIRGETMAYVFKVGANGTLSDRILRLDLCRNMTPDNTFQGGIFHVFKHFTPHGFDTISSHNREFCVDTFSEIFKNVILNFYSEDFQKEKDNYYVAKSISRDAHILRGIYYKYDNLPVYFINSMRIDGIIY